MHFALLLHWNRELIVPSAELSLEAVVEGNMNNVCSSMSKYLEDRKSVV